VVSDSAATASTHDPFADDALERLIRSNQDYQRAHGHYIVPLAERLLAARQEIAATARVVHAARVYQLERAGGVPAVYREAFLKLDAALVDLYREVPRV
jgi:hypothetical protein